MARRLILRFRDLVTEPGATIAEHRTIWRTYGEVWWGWWKRNREISPVKLFAELREEIDASSDKAIKGYLFDTDQNLLFSCRIADIKVAPIGAKIPAPDPRKTPEYYHRAPYAAWFLLRSLEDQGFEELRLYFDAFPTRPDLQSTLDALVRQPIAELDQLRNTDATLWVVQEIEGLR